MNDLAATLVKALKDRGVTLAVAESLTGGRVSDQLVNVPGASEVFLGSVVSYATDAKARLLNVDSELLEDNPGPIQAAVVEQMADGVVSQFQPLTSGRPLLACATTGVAGPDPSYGQPVGTVFVAVRFQDTVEVREFLFTGDRSSIRDQSVTAVLQLALGTLESSFDTSGHNGQ